MYNKLTRNNRGAQISAKASAIAKFYLAYPASVNISFKKIQHPDRELDHYQNKIIKCCLLYAKSIWKFLSKFVQNLLS